MSLNELSNSQMNTYAELIQFQRLKQQASRLQPGIVLMPHPYSIEAQAFRAVCLLDKKENFDGHDFFKTLALADYYFRYQALPLNATEEQRDLCFRLHFEDRTAEFSTKIKPADLPISEKALFFGSIALDFAANKVRSTPLGFLGFAVLKMLAKGGEALTFAKYIAESLDLTSDKIYLSNDEFFAIYSHESLSRKKLIHLAEHSCMPLPNEARRLVDHEKSKNSDICVEYFPDYSLPAMEVSPVPVQHLGLPTFTTSIELPLCVLEKLTSYFPLENQDLCDFALPSSFSELKVPVQPIAPYLPLAKKEEKPMTFRELATIKECSLDVSPSGRPIARAVLESGAQIGLELHRHGAAVHLSVPIGPGIFEALGTGMCYAAPLAAIIVVTNLISQNQRKHVAHKAKHHAKKAQNELNAVKNSIEKVEGINKAFTSKEISEKDFLEKINKISAELQKVLWHMEKYGRFADDHKRASGYAAMSYFSNRVQLKQIDLNLHQQKNSLLAQHKVETQFAPQLPQQSVTYLIDNLKRLNDKKLLTLEEKFQSHALSRELFTRIDHGLTQEELAALGPLVDQPVAIHCNPEGIAKPAHIASRHFDTTPHRAERRSDNLKYWADKLKALYDNFLTAAENGNLSAMETEKAKILDHIQEKNSGAKLGKYKLQGENYPQSALDYYTPYITKIKSSMDETLKKAHAASQGIVTPESTPLLTAPELQEIKIAFAFNSFNSAYQKFYGEGASLEEREGAFSEMTALAVELQNLDFKPDETVAELLENIRLITKNYGSFAAYSQAVVIEQKVFEALDNFNKASKIFFNEECQPQEKEEAFALMALAAAQLKALDYKAEGEAAEMLEQTLQIQNQYGSYGSFVRAQEDRARTTAYTTDILYRYVSPAVSSLFHLFNNLERYEGYDGLKMFGKFLAAGHSMAPMVLPSGLNFCIANLCQENKSVTDALQDVCMNSWRTNHVSKFLSPKETLKSVNSLNKSANLAQVANTAFQYTAKLINFTVKELFGGNKKIEAWLPETCASLNDVTTAFYYANLFNKTTKYVSKRALGLKIHKIGQGVTHLALAIPDLLEFMATELEESSSIFKKIAKKCLPSFQGNLPESWIYYVGKDVFSTVALMVISRNAVSAGLALGQGANMVFNTYNDKYCDDVLAAIMLNYRYFQTQEPSRDRTKKMASTVSNLKHYLKDNYVISTEDSKIQKAAKLLYFETRLNEESWEKIVRLTAIDFNQNGTAVFKDQNADIFNGAHLIITRFNAIQELIIQDANFGIENILKVLEEVNAVIDYFEKKSAPMTDAEKEKYEKFMEPIREKFKELKLTFLSDFSIFYVQNRNRFPRQKAEELFASHPSSQYGITLWHMLGCIGAEIFEVVESHETRAEMMALQLFCFRKMEQILEANPKRSNEENLRLLFLRMVIWQLQSSLTEDGVLFWEGFDFTTLPQYIEKLAK